MINTSSTQFEVPSNIMLELPVCPICASPRQNKKYFDFTPYKVKQCSSCNLWYLSPRLKEEIIIKSYSQPGYFEGKHSCGYNDQDISYSSQELSLKQTFRTFLKKLNQLKLTGGDLLEIGSAYGFFLEEARSSFNSLTGTDFSTDAVNRIKSLGLNAIRGGIEEIPKNKKYDLIISINVIEHVYKPIEFVTQLTKHLKRDGRIILATPYANNIWFKLFGHKWPSFKIPEHITFFDKSTLSALFDTCGAINTTNISLPAAYPSSIVFKKLGLKLPPQLGQFNFWIPATLIAIAAQFDNHR